MSPWWRRRKADQPPTEIERLARQLVFLRNRVNQLETRNASLDERLRALEKKE